MAFEKAAQQSQKMYQRPSGSWKMFGVNRGKMAKACSVSKVRLILVCFVVLAQPSMESTDSTFLASPGR